MSAVFLHGAVHGVCEFVEDERARKEYALVISFDDLVNIRKGPNVCVIHPAALASDREGAWRCNSVRTTPARNRGP
jgi:hypothetical protein